jgi:hypothetical protein
MQFKYGLRAGQLATQLQNSLNTLIQHCSTSQRHMHARVYILLQQDRIARFGLQEQECNGLHAKLEEQLLLCVRMVVSALQQ